MIALNKEIISHPDFNADFEKEICDFLEALIDAEFEKGNETDFDFIDECADTINAIRSGDTSAIMPVISRRDFIKKVSGNSYKNKVKAAIAICAALAVIFGANIILNQNENTDIISRVSGLIAEILKGEIEEAETTAHETTAITQPETTKAPVVTAITVKTDESFKTEYYVGEEFISNGLTVYAEYNNGERILLGSDEYTVTVAADFGKAPEYETVTVKAYGFEEKTQVRVIETLETKKLTSVYALFPDNFDFTADDLSNIDLSVMSVYAVYSDESEKELSEKEYTVEISDESTIFEKKALVTVSFEGCSASFMITKGGR